MQVLLGSGDGELADALSDSFVDDHVVRVQLGGLGEPDAFQRVVDVDPDAVILAPDWAGDETDQLRGSWWLARAADMARVPVTVVSTAAVFDTRDRRARTEFDAAEPDTAAGRSARAVEQLVERTTRRCVIVRVGPMDVGTRTLSSLIAAPEGVVGGGSMQTTPVRVQDVGPVVRQLAIGRRYGIWHVGAGAVSIVDCARGLGLAEPRPGDARVPVPLETQMMHVSGMPAVDAWRPKS